PSLILDTKKVHANSQAMEQKSKINNEQVRPHFKRHQTHKIREWFRDAGVRAITVSSLKMASDLALDGWKDITVAFPVNVLEADAINKLAEQVSLRVLVVSEEAIHLLAPKLTQKNGMYIELDPGYGRSGIPVSDFEPL